MKRSLSTVVITALLTSAAFAQWSGGGPASRTYTFTPSGFKTITFNGTGSGGTWTLGQNSLSATTTIVVNKYAYLEGNFASNVVMNGYDTTQGVNSGSRANIAFNSSMSVTFSNFSDATTAPNPLFGANASTILTLDYAYMVKTYGSTDGNFTAVPKGASGLTITLFPGDYGGFLATLALQRTIKPALNNPAATYSATGTVTFTMN